MLKSSSCCWRTAFCSSEAISRSSTISIPAAVETSSGALDASPSVDPTSDAGRISSSSAGGGELTGREKPSAIRKWFASMLTPCKASRAACRGSASWLCETFEACNNTNMSSLVWSPKPRPFFWSLVLAPEEMLIETCNLRKHVLLWQVTFWVGVQNLWDVAHWRLVLEVLRSPPSTCPKHIIKNCTLDPRP